MLLFAYYSQTFIDLLALRIFMNWSSINLRLIHRLFFAVLEIIYNNAIRRIFRRLVKYWNWICYHLLLGLLVFYLFSEQRLKFAIVVLCWMKYQFGSNLGRGLKYLCHMLHYESQNLLKSSMRPKDFLRIGNNQMKFVPDLDFYWDWKF